jgi:hypothetical protein
MNDMWKLIKNEFITNSDKTCTFVEQKRQLSLTGG